MSYLGELASFQQESLNAEDPSAFRRSATSQSRTSSKSQKLINEKISKLSKEMLSFVQERKGFWETQTKPNFREN